MALLSETAQRSEVPHSLVQSATHARVCVGQTREAAELHDKSPFGPYRQPRQVSFPPVKV